MGHDNDFISISFFIFTQETIASVMYYIVFINESCLNTIVYDYC